MEYKVLYRKYRPTSFEKIVGQDYTITMLKNAIINDKISHAYLFTGPRGTGKTSTAKVFAKTINCEHRVQGEACGKCPSCLNFNNSSDIIEIDAASNNGVDDIRELINNVKIAPSESRYKIYIIDEVHMMTPSAFNALLLTLEEPPKHAIFIMATTNVESVPITILSRCQRFNFQKVAIDIIKEQLKDICEKEKISITDDALEEIAYLSEGGLRDALSLLDQLSSDKEPITIDKILLNYGSISSLFIRNFIDAFFKNDINSVIKGLHDLEVSSSDYKVFIKKLISELILKAISIKQGTFKAVLSYEDVKNLVFDLNDCMNKINIYINPYLLIKVVLLNYMKSDCGNSLERKEEKVFNTVKMASDDELIKENQENKIADLATSSPEERLADEQKEHYLNKLKKIRINNCLALAKKDLLKKYQELFKDVSTYLSSDFQSFLEDSKIVAGGDNIIILATPLKSTADLINCNLVDIEKQLVPLFSKKIAIIALSNQEWNLLKQEYIQNLKNGVKYEVIDESNLDILKPDRDSQLESFAKELFNSDKIQIIEKG